jgi:hypothetical protein
MDACTDSGSVRTGVGKATAAGCSDPWSVRQPRVYKESDAAGLTLSDWCTKGVGSPVSLPQQPQSDAAIDEEAGRPLDPSPPPVHLLLSDDEGASVVDADKLANKEAVDVDEDVVESHEDPVDADTASDRGLEQAKPPDGLSKKELKSWGQEREKEEKQQKKLQAHEEKERKKAEAAEAKAAKKSKGTQEQEQEAVENDSIAETVDESRSGMAEDAASGTLAADETVDGAAPPPDLIEDKASKKARERAEKERQKLEAQEEKERKKELAAEEKAAKRGKNKNVEPESAVPDAEPELEPA